MVSTTIDFSEYRIRRVASSLGKSFIRAKHYSRSCHNGPSPCYGLFVTDDRLPSGEALIGVLAFATPCSENVRASVFGSEYKDHVTELHRLVIKDSYCGIEIPKNTESWFISRCLKELKKDKSKIWAVLSFADSTEGHTGVIYKATNAKFCGMTSKATFYLDRDMRLRHPRQNGVNITTDEAITRGWSPVKRLSKHRYLWLLPNSKGHKKQLERMSKFHDFR